LVEFVYNLKRQLVSSLEEGILLQHFLEFIVVPYHGTTLLRTSYKEKKENFQSEYKGTGT